MHSEEHDGVTRGARAELSIWAPARHRLWLPGDGYRHEVNRRLTPPEVLHGGGLRRVVVVRLSPGQVVQADVRRATTRLS